MVYRYRGKRCKIEAGTSYTLTSNLTLYAYWYCSGTTYSNCSGLSYPNKCTNCLQGSCDYWKTVTTETTYSYCSTCGSDSISTKVSTCSNKNCSYRTVEISCAYASHSLYSYDEVSGHTWVCPTCGGDWKGNSCICKIHGNASLTSSSQKHCAHGRTSAHSY